MPLVSTCPSRSHAAEPGGATTACCTLQLTRWPGSLGAGGVTSGGLHRPRKSVSTCRKRIASSRCSDWHGVKWCTSSPIEPTAREPSTSRHESPPWPWPWPPPPP
eukprot:4374675-Prymnesium_polylepis.1